jgi:hypothetical protein
MSRRTRAIHIAIATACAVVHAHPALAAEQKAKKAPATKSKTAVPDSTMKIEAGSEGKQFESITVEGEDRVRIQFERPPLRLELDPQSAPGLDWESIGAVLDAEWFDFVDPLLAGSAFDRLPHSPRPWLDSFRDGPVARFQPEVSDVEKWALEVADSRGRTVARFGGSGKPPKEISWDGATTDGTPARADLTYSYVLTASDRAGNRRSFVGEGFEIPPHVSGSRDGIALSFSVPLESEERVPVSLVLEAATRLNHAVDASKPVRVEVTAPTFNLAKSIADEVVAALRPHLMGEPSRIAVGTNVDAGGGERASVTIRSGGVR